MRQMLFFVNGLICRPLALEALAFKLASLVMVRQVSVTPIVPRLTGSEEHTSILTKHTA